MATDRYSEHSWYTPAPQSDTSFVERALVKKGVVKSTNTVKALSLSVLIAAVSFVYSLLALALPQEVVLGEDVLRDGEQLPSYVRASE